MSPVASRLFSEPLVVVTRAEVVGADGRVVNRLSSVQVLGAFRQRVSADAFDDGVVVTDEALVYLPPETVVEPGDAVVVRGDEYEVVSTGFPAVNFRTGQPHHLEARVRRSQR